MQMLMQETPGMRQRVIDMHITFVCTGNTCRSPMAEGLFNKILADRGIDGITCSSCGLGAFGADSAALPAVEVLKDMDIDISSHRSRAFSPYILSETDLFVCMSNSHAMAIKGISQNARVTVLNGGVADPYGGSIKVYEECANQIKNALEIFADLIIMKIVPFDKAHVDGVLGLENECFSAPWSEQSIKEELENENAHFLVAQAGDKVIGYMGVHEVAGEAYVANVAVGSAYRRKGVATALMSAAEKGARERCCDFISLEVRKSNCSAISLYEKRGYELKGERKNFYSNPTENAIIMTLELNI